MIKSIIVTEIIIFVGALLPYQGWRSDPFPDSWTDYFYWVIIFNVAIGIIMIFKH